MVAVDRTKTKVSPTLSGDTIKYLGVTMDKGLTFKTYAVQKCSKAIHNLLHIRSVRKYFEEACKILMPSLVLSHLDYGNALLSGLP
jgi:hypothetical protein